MKKLFIFLIYAAFSFLSLFSIEFKLGIENIPHHVYKILQKNRIGLITNQTGITQNKQTTLSVLLQQNCNVQYIFAPEHGVTGTVPAGETVTNKQQNNTGIPIISLYREGQGIAIEKHYLNNIDILLFDIQDSGMRHYTYISTLYKIIKIAAKEDKQLFVFDRPNPLGRYIEGPSVEKNFESFISIAPIPLRHGLTIGELARYYNEILLQKKATVFVVPMHHYNKDTHTFTLQSPLSPNIQSEQSLYGYSFLGLLGEIKPFDVGIGTKRAFSQILIPKETPIPLSIWKQLHTIFQSYNISARFVSRYIGKHNKPSSGFLLSLHAVKQIHTFDLFLDIVTLFAENISLTYAPSFDKAIGTDKIRTILKSTNTRAHKKRIIKQLVQNDITQFTKNAAHIALY